MRTVIIAVAVQIEDADDLFSACRHRGEEDVVAVFDRDGDLSVEPQIFAAYEG